MSVQTTSEAKVRIPPKLIPVFQGEARYRGAYGGRGSAKTRTFAKMSAVVGYMAGMSGQRGVILVGREFLNSLDDSSLEEVKTAIRDEPWLAAYYEIGEKFIRSRDGRVKYAFVGLRHNLSSIKSKARIILAWIDEGEPVSEAGWRVLIPTIREEGSEIWVTWNPEADDSPTHKRFRLDPPEGAKIVEMNWRDNPWFPEVLDRDRLQDEQKRPEDYLHVWEGGFLVASEARIFRNYRVGEVEVPDNVVWFYGVDWGFSVDPLAGVRFCFPSERVLYITHEAHKVGVPQEETAAYLLKSLPDLAKWPAIADSARPDSIDFCRRHGIPKLKPSIKGQGSVEDGITFLQGQDIVIHPRCVETKREFDRYSYKRDRQTEEILPVVEDAWNHLIDSLRYGSERLHRKGKLTLEGEKMVRTVRDYGHSDPEDYDSWRTI